jgi:hypothetical protein
MSFFNKNTHGPRFEHDCEDCKFIGQQNGADVYLHSTILSAEIVKVTLIKRHSSEGSDYTCREHFL